MYPKRIEDIYPCTIINMRFGDDFVIFNSHSDNTDIASIEENEEIYYELDDHIRNKILSFYCCGKGDTIQKAFEDYQLNYLEYFNK